MLILSDELARRIRAQGAESYPQECCGALLGTEGEKGREVLDVFPILNRRDDSPRNRFSITADDFRAAERAAREQGLDVVAGITPTPTIPRGRANSIATTLGRGTAT